MIIFLTSRFLKLDHISVRFDEYFFYIHNVLLSTSLFSVFVFRYLCTYTSTQNKRKAKGEKETALPCWAGCRWPSLTLRAQHPARRDKTAHMETGKTNANPANPSVAPNPAT